MQKEIKKEEETSKPEETSKKDEPSKTSEESKSNEPSKKVEPGKGDQASKPVEAAPNKKAANPGDSSTEKKAENHDEKAAKADSDEPPDLQVIQIAEPKANKKKLLANVIINLIGTVALILFLLLMQTEAATKKQAVNSQIKLNEVVQIMMQNTYDQEDSLNLYDDVFTSKADTLSYLLLSDEELRNKLYSSESSDTLKEICSSGNFDLDSLIIINIKGDGSAEQMVYARDYPTITSFDVNADAIRPYVSDGTALRNEFIPFNYNHYATGDYFSPYIIDSPTDSELASSSNFIIRYYGAKITESSLLLIGQKPNTIYNNINNLVSLNTILSDVTVGNSGYVFAVDESGKFSYYPDTNLQGKPAKDYGVDTGAMSDGFNGWLSVDNKTLFCVGMKLTKDHIYDIFDKYYLPTLTEKVSKGTMTQAELEKTRTEFCEKIYARYGSMSIYIAAVTHEEIASSRTLTCSVGAILFLLVSGLEIAYCYIVKNEAIKLNRQKSLKLHKHLFLNYDVCKKVTPVTIIGVLFIFIGTFFAQNIYALSKQNANSINYLDNVTLTLSQNDIQAESLKSQCDRSFLNKCDSITYIMKNDESIYGLFFDDSGNYRLTSRDDITPGIRGENQNRLKAIASEMNVLDIYVMNLEGQTIATSSVYQDFDLSTEATNQSYAFWEILNGHKTEVIQEAQIDDVGQSSQYLAKPLYRYFTYEGVDYKEVVGMIEISVDPDIYLTQLKAAQIDKVLDNVIVGTSGFAFAVNQADNTFAYFPQLNDNYTLVGKVATEYGLPKSALKDGYFNQVTIDSTSYWIRSMIYGDYYVYVATPESEVTAQVAPIAGMTAAVSFIFLAIFSGVIMFSRHDETSPEGSELQLSDKGNVVEIIMPNGKKKKVTTATSRWDESSLSWSAMTSGQKFGVLIKSCLVLFGLFLTVIFFGYKTFFSQTSIIYFIESGVWEKGFNIFSITYSLMTMLIIAVISAVLRILIKFSLRSANSRLETVGRLVSNLIKYACYIWIIFAVLTYFGVDTNTLLTSAGILSLVIGLGAQSLIQDILAGLFIVFEGEFRVGDIVTIGDWRGTVLEIGLRTTKIENTAKNIKVFNNSDISGVINMTKEYSYAVVDMPFDYGESIERVEAILKEEFPNIKAKLHNIKDGPFYKGVAELGDSSINVRIVAQCEENKRMQLTRDLTRELMMIFQKHDILIPFNQIVVNQPEERNNTANKKDKKEAKEFNEEQQIVAPKIEVEQTK